MADHLDAFDPAETLLQDVNPVDVPDLHLHSPGMDTRVDITDIYAFQKPGDANRSILIMNVNPVAPLLAPAFRPDAIYELNVDTNGDAVADIAFRIRFSEPEGGAQTATVHRATGALAAGTNDGGPAIIAGAPVSFGAEAQITDQNGYRFFAGLRSDPFFFDLLGFLQGLSFTGSDFFAGLNVFGIVLEVPNTALGSNPQIGAWALTIARGSIIDQMGRPAINTVFNKGADKNTFNQTPPNRQRDLFLDKFVAVLHALDPSRSNGDNVGLAEVLLPDILTYNFNSSAGFLNGRKLADDVIDAELQLLTGNPAAGDGVGPHTDYLDHFPYLGRPH
jgi:hypothetical protein